MNSFRPLEGVRVLAFEAAVSLPAGTRILADMGAEVVQVRPIRATDDAFIIVNYDGSFLSKKTVALDLRHPEAKAVALRLAAGADVVCTNLRPGVLKRFGIDYEAIVSVRPDTIMLQISGYGSPGPWASFPVFGHSVEAAGGMNTLIGEPTDQPVQVGSRVLADQLSGKYAALALLAALAERDRTGRGQNIDVSMYEAIIHVLGEFVLSTAATGVAPERRGNRHPQFAPQGIYPSAGDDEWVALTVASDDEWDALRRILRDPPLDTPDYSTVAGRHRHHDAIDAVISAWTSVRTNEEAARLFQTAGIAAGPVFRPSHIALDEQHRHRRFFQPVGHDVPVYGFLAHPHMSLATLFEGYDRAPLVDSRNTGADNEDVLCRWGDYTAGEVQELIDARVVVAPRPDEDLHLPAPPSRGWGGRPGFIDPEYASRLGLPIASVSTVRR